jgi:SAM-dependent methyltransferase
MNIAINMRKIKQFKIIKNILENYANYLKSKLRIYHCSAGSTHMAFSIKESLDYIHNVFNDYLVYGGLSVNDIKGKNVLEIGPGDNLGVALSFIAHGAQKVICLDRVYSFRNEAQQSNIYAALRATFTGDMLRNFDGAINFQDGRYRINANKVKYIYGKGIDDSEQVISGEEFDIIVSRAVLEHIYDIDEAFSVMDRHLKRGGHLIHKVDLRDHEIFSRDGFNPFTFLTIPGLLWKYMTKDSGKPNRRRVDYFDKKLKDLRYEYKTLITHIITREAEMIPHREKVVKYRDYDDKDIKIIDDIRRRLAKEFSSLSDEALLIGGIFVAAKK